MAGSSTQSLDLDNEDVPLPSSSQVAQPPCTTQGRPLKSKVWQYMDREVLSNGVVKATCQFYPRFKLEGVEYCYEKLFGETYSKEMTNTLKDTLFELFDEYKGAFHVSSPGIGTSIVGTPDASRQDGMIGCFGSPNDAVEFQAFLNKRRKVDNEKSELELYFEEKIKNLDSVVKDGDVLAYWKNNSERYPCLSSMARDILTIPISTVPSESAFSMGKKLINPWRSSLSSKIIESLACLEDWYRAKGLTLGPSLFFGYSEETTADGEDEDDEDEDDLDRDS